MRLALAVVLLSLSACIVRTQTLTSATAAATEALPIQTWTAVPQSGATATNASPSNTPIAALTMTPASVTISAVNGNLYIRRGSGSEFNPIATLLQGQTATAAGRDILNQWLYIPIPSQPGKFGWVSTLTIYSSVGGRTMDLPVVDSPLAVPAFIENCSLNNMIIQPLGVIVPPGSQFPDNIIQFDPGEYTIRNYDLPKNPEVVIIELVEGETYPLTADGTVAHHKCAQG
jgi:hypothetical protein